MANSVDVKTNKPQPIIAVRNLSVTYPLGHKQSVQALEGINLEIYPGEFIIFFGPSGCGKSTLLYSISGLETHARGTIEVNGHHVTTMAREEAARFRQKEIGMIFQAFYLIPSLSVFKNVLLPQMAINAAVSERNARAKELLTHFGVDTQANKLPTDLSGGQQQRVAICRALVNDPSILLADEPVGNLDSKSSMEVIRLILELNERQKKTVILVTHDPSHLHFADRVFHMRDGRIIDTTVNRPMKSAIEPSQVELPRDLSLLVRSFSQLKSGQTGTLLIPYKAKEIVAEVLTGLSVEEMARIEHEVQSLMIDAISDPSSMMDLLDDPTRFGGLGLDHRTAVKLTERLIALVKEIRTLQASEQSTNVNIPLEATSIRQHIIDVFHVHIPREAAIHRFEEIIAQRLSATIDQAAVNNALRLPPPEGIGWSPAVADKVAKRIELIVLGKFQS